MTDDVPLIDRDTIRTLLVTIDIMQLVRIYGLSPEFVLWGCELCEYADSQPGGASALRSIEEHMKTEHGAT
jgi:hypothetical protein